MNNKALLIVDVQNDFCPGGSYPVPKGSEVVKPLNSMITYAKAHGWRVYASRDWHPRSTLEKEGWTAHCIQHTKGAEYHPELNVDNSVTIISKGEDLSESHYSAFNGDNISLSEELQKNNIQTLYIGGLAFDYCVKNSALDSVRNGLKTFVVLDACRGIYKRKSKNDVIQELKDAGVEIVETDEILK
jgi:nicotinamidase/pyrazinamidase